MKKQLIRLYSRLHKNWVKNKDGGWWLEVELFKRYRMLKRYKKV